MKIVNIDAPELIAEKVVHLDVPVFVLDVVRPLERGLHHLQHHSMIAGVRNYNGKQYTPIRKFDEKGYENIANLLHTIPIYLRDLRPEEYENTDIVDTLGAYFPNTKNDNPYIELYLSNIENASSGIDSHFKWLFTIVLIHELAHASLDIFNYELCHQATEKIQYCTQFGKWREESMANAVALRIIKDYNDKDFYEYSMSFMLSQPAEYALGVLMQDFGSRDFRSVIAAKENGVDSNLQQEWLNIATNNPVTKDLLCWNDYLSSRFVYVYNNKYYTGEKELIFDIVDDVLKGFSKSNNRKMSIIEFKSVFPYIKTGAKMSYEPSAQVQSDSRFTSIELEDGNLSLYYFWDNASLHNFIKNITCNLKEYKNF